MVTWECSLAVEPTAKAAVKVSMQGGFVRKYTPAKTRNAMNDIRYALQKASAPKFIGAVDLHVIFYMKKPKSVKKNALPIKRPDASNLIKLFEDAANNILWDDDSQIIKLLVEKVYSEAVPSIFVRVNSIE